MTRFPKGLLLATCIFLHVATTLFAQHPAWRPYTTADGLPGNEVYGLLQDSRGFMWFTTNVGICRFNGYEFSRPADTSAYAGNEAFRMAEDAQGRIWFNRLDASVWMVENDTVRAWKYNYIIERLRGKFSSLGDLVIDRQGTVWIQLPTLGILVVQADGTQRIISADKGAFVFTEVENRLISSTVTPFTATLRHYVVEQVHTMPLYQWRENALHLAGKVVIPQTQWEKSIYYGAWRLHNGDILLNTAQTFCLYRDKKIVRPWSCDVAAGQIFEDRDGSILLSSLGAGTSGLLHFASIDHFQRNEYSILLPGHSVSNALRDREGGWWATTTDAGIFYCKNPEMGIFDQSSGLASHVVQSITTDGKETVFASLRPKSIHVIHARSGAVSSLPLPPFRNNSNSSLVRFDPQTGRLWYNPFLSSYKNGVWENATFRLPHAKKRLPIDAKKITQSPVDDRWWVSAFADFFSVDPVSGDVVRYRSDTLEYWRTHAVAQDFERNIWVATDRSGLQCWKRDHYEPPPFQHPALRHSVRLVEVLPDSTLLLSLRGQGLLMRHKNGQFTHLTTQNGLSTDWISELDITPEGVIYACSNAGLNIIRRNTNGTYRIDIIGVRDGLPSNQVNDVTWLNDALWIATDQGIAVLSGKPAPTPMPAPQLEHFKVNGRPSPLPDSICILRHTENNLVLHFFSLHYRSSGDILYRYRLLGADTTFLYTRSPEVNFPGLAPGRYTFEVQAQTEEGDWSAAGRWVFDIRPPWWKTNWFFALMIAMIMAAALLLYQIQVRRIQQDAAVREKVRELESAALRAQMNPHFIFNCLQAIQSFILRNEREEATRYLARFAKLIRLTLHASVDGTHTLAEEIAMLKNYLLLEQMRFKGQFDFEIHLTPETDPENIQLPPLLVQPFVENAVIHGLQQRESGGKVTVIFSKKQNSLAVSISDNGSGFEATTTTEAKPHHSVGMMLTQKRLDMLAGAGKIGATRLRRETLLDADGAVAGARVEFEIPV